jgi:hypothetical protein
MHACIEFKALKGFLRVFNPDINVQNMTRSSENESGQVIDG